MCSWSKAARLLCAAGLASALLAAGTAGAEETAQPGPEWYLPTGHWAYMYCDYFVERGALSLTPKNLFNGDKPVLLREFIRAAAELGELRLRTGRENYLASNPQKQNVSSSLDCIELPVAGVVCDMIYELRGLLRHPSRDISNASELIAKVGPDVGRLDIIWQKLGNADKPLEQAELGDSHPEAWCFDPAVAGDPNRAGLEVLGLIHWAQNKVASIQPKMDFTPLPRESVLPDWTSAALREVLGATQSGRAELNRHTGKLTRESAIAQLDYGVAALRDEPEIKPHILLSAWGLAAALYGRDAPLDTSLQHRRTELSDLGGLALKVKQPITAGIPEYAYADVPTTGMPEYAYADVPTTHWMYPVLDSLTKVRWLEGYPEGFFQSGRILNRYEIAQVTARLFDTLDLARAPQTECLHYPALLSGQLFAANARMLLLRLST